MISLHVHTYHQWGELGLSVLCRAWTWLQPIWCTSNRWQWTRWTGSRPVRNKNNRPRVGFNLLVKSAALTCFRQWLLSAMSMSILYIQSTALTAEVSFTTQWASSCRVISLFIDTTSTSLCTKPYLSDSSFKFKDKVSFQYTYNHKAAHSSGL